MAKQLSGGGSPTTVARERGQTLNPAMSLPTGDQKPNRPLFQPPSSRTTSQRPFKPLMARQTSLPPVLSPVVSGADLSSTTTEDPTAKFPAPPTLVQMRRWLGQFQKRTDCFPAMNRSLIDGSITLYAVPEHNKHLHCEPLADFWQLYRTQTQSCINDALRIGAISQEKHRSLNHDLDELPQNCCSLQGFILTRIEPLETLHLLGNIHWEVAQSHINSADTIVVSGIGSLETLNSQLICWLQLLQSHDSHCQYFLTRQALVWLDQRLSQTHQQPEVAQALTDFQNQFTGGNTCSARTLESKLSILQITLNSELYSEFQREITEMFTILGKGQQAAAIQPLSRAYQLYDELRIRLGRHDPDNLLMVSLFREAVIHFGEATAKQYLIALLADSSTVRDMKTEIMLASQERDSLSEKVRSRAVKFNAMLDELMAQILLTIPGCRPLAVERYLASIHKSLSTDPESKRQVINTLMKMLAPLKPTSSKVAGLNLEEQDTLYESLATSHIEQLCDDPKFSDISTLRAQLIDAMEANATHGQVNLLGLLPSPPIERTCKLKSPLITALAQEETFQAQLIDLTDSVSRELSLMQPGIMTHQKNRRTFKNTRLKKRHSQL
ncbi:hypothetical protein [Parendozoicomonas haliclonae]|uniref:Uncharacterized protein n=1 Tax=Parendozoicomonas haliclonae TaxID=1960125 RepID=A0A1X7AJT1_9GAMM|nr:hypothetical protein [Parendozoicomonas haliclonae]SMA47051.1 hypothetical protein EHSB41UT_02295 [Parendozoicomonas haliclonae]